MGIKYHGTLLHSQRSYNLIPTELFCHELKRLVSDYYKCENKEMKGLIYSDILLLREALFLCDQPEPEESN
jgi:hypothetical protein